MVEKNQMLQCCFNRTIVELKSVSVFANHPKNYSFNRTIVELKCPCLITIIKC